jgi:hypothetical protein
MKVHLLTATVLSLGIIAGTPAAQAASARSPQASQTTGVQGGDNRSSTSTKGTSSSGKEDNPGYLTGPMWSSFFNSDEGMQPRADRYYGMQPRSYGSRSYGFGGYTNRALTPCRGDQLRYVNGACHAIGPT